MNVLHYIDKSYTQMTFTERAIRSLFSTFSNVSETLTDTCFIACKQQTYFRSPLLSLRKIMSVNPSNKSAFWVTGILVKVMKFTFQSVFGNSRQNTRHASTWRREESLELYSIFDLIGQHQNKRFHVTEIVLLLRFTDVIFWRERLSDDRKDVCASQATCFMDF